MAKHILIVEGSASTRKALTRNLWRAGITPADFTEASGDVESTEALTGPFDLIVSDVVDEAMGNGAKDRLKVRFTPEKPGILGPFLK